MRDALGAALSYSRYRARPVAPALVVVMSALAAVLSWHALHLPSPTGQEQFLPKDHMYVRAMRESERRRSGLMALNVPGSIFVGLGGVDRAKSDTWAVDVNRGNATWDESFGLESVTAQRTLMRLASRLRTAPCDLRGCHPALLAKPRSVRCVLDYWLASLNGSSLPYGSQFEPALLKCVRGPGAAHRELVGFVGGKLRFVHIAFESTFQSMQNGHRDWLGLQRRFEDLVERETRGGPPAMRNAQVVLYRTVLNRRAGRSELVDVSALMELYPTLQDSLRRNLLWCVCACAVVLLCTTRSLTMSIIASLTIVAIVGSLLGCLKASHPPPAPAPTQPPPRA